MENANNTTLLVISSTEEDVRALTSIIAYNKPIIQEFVENMTPQEMITYCAWFMGQLDTQQSELSAAFDKAREVGRDVAKIMQEGYKRENPGFDSNDGLLLLYPPMPSPMVNTMLSESPTNLIQ